MFRARAGLIASAPQGKAVALSQPEA